MGFCLSSLLQLTARAICKDTLRVGVDGRPVVREAEGSSDFVGAEVPHFDVGVADQGCLDRRRHDDPGWTIGRGVDVQFVSDGDVLDVGREGDRSRGRRLGLPPMLPEFGARRLKT